MEKEILSKFRKALGNANGQRLPMNSFRGHLGELTPDQRRHIKSITLEKFLIKYPSIFLVCDDIVYLMKQETKGQSSLKTIPKDKTHSMDGEDQCILCYENIFVFAIGKCEHPVVCFRCSAKSRVLCKDLLCPVCRENLDEVAFTKSKEFGKLEIESFVKDGYGIYYEDNDIFSSAKSFLSHKCKCCDTNFQKMESLVSHMSAKHSKKFCEICLRHLKVFTVEREIFGTDDLLEHKKSKHKLCEFCDTYYPDKDELQRHLNMNHHSCTICNLGTTQLSYYANEYELTKHYREWHIVCEECLMDNPQIAAFQNEIDLKAHKLEMHSKTKSERKKAQNLDISFTYTSGGALNFAGTSASIRNHDLLMPSRSVFVPVYREEIGKVYQVVTRTHSFIKNPENTEFEDNVYFDLEAAGLEPTDDLRHHFRIDDFVEFKAVAVTGYKSRWKATEVMKSSSEEYLHYLHSRQQNSPNSLTSASPERELNSIFPTLPRDNAGSAISSWPALEPLNTFPLPSNPGPRNAVVNGTHAQVVMKKTTPPKDGNVHSQAPIGYVHQSLKPTFGFLTRQKDVTEGKDNIFFSKGAYIEGLSSYEAITDLRKVITVGMPLHYELDTTAPKNASAKYRAKKVWRPLAASLLPTPNLNPTSRTNPIPKLPTIPKQPNIHTPTVSKPTHIKPFTIPETVDRKPPDNPKTSINDKDKPPPPDPNIFVTVTARHRKNSRPSPTKKITPPKASASATSMRHKFSGFAVLSTPDDDSSSLDSDSSTSKPVILGAGDVSQTSSVASTKSKNGSAKKIQVAKKNKINVKEIANVGESTGSSLAGIYPNSSEISDQFECISTSDELASSSKLPYANGSGDAIGKEWEKEKNNNLNQKSNNEKKKSKNGSGNKNKGKENGNNGSEKSNNELEQWKNGIEESESDDDMECVYSSGDENPWEHYNPEETKFYDIISELVGGQEQLNALKSQFFDDGFGLSNISNICFIEFHVQTREAFYMYYKRSHHKPRTMTMSSMKKFRSQFKIDFDKISEDLILRNVLQPVTGFMYHVADTCHFIIVTRKKNVVNKVTIFFRPEQSGGESPEEMGFPHWQHTYVYDHDPENNFY